MTLLRRVDTCAHRSRWRTQPGPTLLYALGLLACAFTPVPWIAGPGVGLCAWLGTRRAGVPSAVFWRALAVPLGFVITGAAILCVSLTADAHGLHARFPPEGIATAWVTSMRTVGATSATLMLGLTVPLTTWLGLLRRAHVPTAVRDLILLTYHTLFLLDDCAQGLRRAQLARLGYRTPRQALHTLAGTVQALFVQALQRATRLERGLAARGYRGDLTVLQPANAHPPLAYAAAITVPVVLGAATAVWLALATP